MNRLQPYLARLQPCVTECDQVVVRTLSSPRPHALLFRTDTWRGLHLWVNGLTLLSKLARSKGGP